MQRNRLKHTEATKIVASYTLQSLRYLQLRKQVFVSAERRLGAFADSD